MGRVAYAYTVAKLLLIAGAFALVPHPARAQSTVEAFVAQVSDGLKAIPAQAAGDTAKAVAGCRDVLTRLLNLPGMAQAAGGENWARMSEAQRAAYQEAFTQHLATECARELADYKGEEIALAGVARTPEGDKLAAVRLGTPAKARMILWRLRGRDNAYRAVDVIFEGHSAVVDAHDQFIAIMRATQGDVEAVIKALKAVRK